MNSTRTFNRQVRTRSFFLYELLTTLATHFLEDLVSGMAVLFCYFLLLELASTKSLPSFIWSSILDDEHSVCKKLDGMEQQGANRGE